MSCQLLILLKCQNSFCCTEVSVNYSGGLFFLMNFLYKMWTRLICKNKQNIIPSLLNKYIGHRWKRCCKTQISPTLFITLTGPPTVISISELSQVFTCLLDYVMELKSHSNVMFCKVVKRMRIWKGWWEFTDSFLFGKTLNVLQCIYILLYLTFKKGGEMYCSYILRNDLAA